MDRRQAIQLGLGTSVGSLLSACGSNPYLADEQTLQIKSKQLQQFDETDGETYHWKLALLVPINFEIWGPGVERFAENVHALSRGQMRIDVKGAGEIVPPMQIFDAVKDGNIEMGHAASYFWDGKDPHLKAAVYFTSVPFGMTANGTYAWLHAGGGQDLWDELYAPFNLKSLPLGNTGVQAGGWFRKPIKTMEDLQGMKMRMPGLGGKVLTAAGGVAQTIAPSEIYLALESGRIDATEWIGPYHDYKRGFQNVAPYYYTGGWHEPGSVLELMINKERWDLLPPHLQKIITFCASEADRWMQQQWAMQDAIYYKKLKDDPKVQVADYPVDIASQLKSHSTKLKNEIRDSSEIARKIHDSYHAFQELFDTYHRASELAFIRGRDA